MLSSTRDQLFKISIILLKLTFSQMNQKLEKSALFFLKNSTVSKLKDLIKELLSTLSYSGTTFTNSGSCDP